MEIRARRGVTARIPPPRRAADSLPASPVSYPEHPPGPVETLLLTARQQQAVEQGDLKTLQCLSAEGEDLAGALALAVRHGAASESVIRVLVEKLQVRILSETLQWAASLSDPRKFGLMRRIVMRAPATAENLVTLAQGAACGKLVPWLMPRYRGPVPMEVALNFARKAEATLRNDQLLGRMVSRVRDPSQSPELSAVLARWSAVTLRSALSVGAQVNADSVRALLAAGNAPGLRAVVRHIGDAQKLPGGCPDLQFALLRANPLTLPELTQVCLTYGAVVSRGTLVTLGQRWVAELGATRLFPGGEVLQELVHHVPRNQRALAIETVVGVLEQALIEGPGQQLAVGRALHWLKSRLTAARANSRSPAVRSEPQPIAHRVADPFEARISGATPGSFRVQDG